jgi:UDP-2-acetamido-2,6-beta-L-arabino-hexul-4-ose reductase
MRVLVTGSHGFIAKNLLAYLDRADGLETVSLARNADNAEWLEQLQKADIVFHLAGTNRPPDPECFQKDNTNLTRFIIDTLEERGTPYKLIFSSSTQAVLENPYGKSKKESEEYIRKNVKNGSAVIYRLPGVFGKWCRPNYNSVVATFCYNVANNQPLEIRDPDFNLRLVYVDDIVSSFMRQIRQDSGPGIAAAEVEPQYSITLGNLAAIIRSFEANRNTLFIPNVGDGLVKALYSTWLTYLSVDNFSYNLELKTDSRGSLFELLKSKTGGQIFISTTLPGITRGNHFHHNKTEKFVVIQGNGLIQFRSVGGNKVVEYEVSGNRPQVVDIPPGYIHNITNTGEETMITLFWSNEVFDPQNPDTFYEKV